MFAVTGHPDAGGPQAGAIRLGNRTYRWIWVPGVGLCTDAPPWGDPSSYLPQCPFLMAESGGIYPCAVAGTPYQPIADQLGCRWLPETWDEASWTQWITDHPACGYEAAPI